MIDTTINLFAHCLRRISNPSFELKMHRNLKHLANAVRVLNCALVLLTFGLQNSVAQTYESQEATKKITPANSIARAVGYLQKSQGADGAWHAQEYGTMKQGAAVTSLVLYSLSHLSQEDLSPLRESKTIAKAADFLQKGLKHSKCVANPEGSLDFPVYSTAIVLTAHKKLDLGLTKLQTEAMLDYLRASQCAEPRGFKPGNQNYGGWDILGPAATAGKSSGANVSVSFYVLEAISHYPDSKNEVVLNRAKPWCEKIAAANPKGGFYYTSQAGSTLNKAGQVGDDEAQIPVPYGSATCDGLGILLLTGSKLKSPLASQTVEWLKSNKVYDQVPGFPKTDEIGWNKGLHFYYLAALSRCLNQLSGDREFAKQSIASTICRLQRDDGSWWNEANQMRENESLIATSFALIALGNTSQKTAGVNAKK